MTNKNIKQCKDYFKKQQQHLASAMAYMDSNQDGSAPMPHTIALAVNNRCFLRCVHCDVGQSNQKGQEENFFAVRCHGSEDKLFEIPLETLKGLVDEVAPYKPVIRPTFLEPLLRKDLFELGRYVKQQGMVFNVQTNGVLLSKRYKEIVDSNVDVLRVSIDGPEKIHDQIRGIPGTFKRVIRGLKLLKAYRDSQNKSHPVLGVSFVISGVNYLEIMNFMDELKQTGLLSDVYVAFCFLRFVTKAEAALQNTLYPDFNLMTESSTMDEERAKIDPVLFKRELNLLKSRYPSDRYHFYFNPSAMDDRDLDQWFKSEEFMYPEVTCTIPWNHCQILHNGDVVFNGRCCSPPLGNIRTDSFKKIWNGEIARNFRRCLLEKTNFPACNRCGRNLDVKGNISGGDDEAIG